MWHTPHHKCSVVYVNKPTSSGRNNIVGQCSVCGRHNGNKKTEDALRYYGDIRNVPLWNEELRKAGYKANAEHHRKESEQRRTEWFKDYNAYLRTPEWREKSRMVRERSPTCQGCRKQPSEEAHHMHYDNVGQEFLFELIALCRKCHDRFHERKRAKYIR